MSRASVVTAAMIPATMSSGRNARVSDDATLADRVTGGSEGLVVTPTGSGSAVDAATPP
jgi:hypothetical protein